MPIIRFIPRSAFENVRKSGLDKNKKCELIADMARFNTLAAVKRAGSGHLGSSLSAMDIVVWLYEQVLNVRHVGVTSPDRDVFFSSKGHDVPGLYSVLYSHGIVGEERFLRLRRLNGLDGHPDVGIPGVEANTGSLGMGISKGRGIVWAKKQTGHSGRVFVMVGDGEFQEGQNFEALQSTVQQGMAGLTVIMDHNKVQSDKPISEIVDLRELGKKFESFGWHVVRINGHDFGEIESALGAAANEVKKPTFIIADTIKGRGVSFMEHPSALKAGKGSYPWHAGAPDDASFEKAQAELSDRINRQIDDAKIPPIELFEPEAPEQLVGPSLSAHNALGEPVSLQLSTKFEVGAAAEYVVEAYGAELVELAKTNQHLVVLDADLAADCRTRRFELEFPDRFIQNGIAEQDMVSMAAGLARHGLLPVVNSFASFLAARANEQIYNQVTEKSRVIYALHYGGLIPAGPGKSHQSLRDISLLAALPRMTIVQPANAMESRRALQYAVEQCSENIALRFVIGPSPRTISMADDYDFVLGRGSVLRAGREIVLFAYGPVMLHEALGAAEMLSAHNVAVKVVNMPWLNRFDIEWLDDTLADAKQIFVLEDHATVGGLGDGLLRALIDNELLGERTFRIFGVDGFPACGTPPEVLRYHRLDAVSLAARIMNTSSDEAIASPELASV